MMSARQRGQRLCPESEVKRRWARQGRSKMWRHGSWMGGLVASEVGLLGTLVKGERQMVQRREVGGMFLMAMGEAVRRKSSFAVVCLRSERVVGEMGIVVVFWLFSGNGVGRKGRKVELGGFVAYGVMMFVVIEA